MRSGPTIMTCYVSVTVTHFTTTTHLVGKSFVTTAVLNPCSLKPIPARNPAPPAPTTTASYSWSTEFHFSKSIQKKSIEISKNPTISHFVRPKLFFQKHTHTHITYLRYNHPPISMRYFETVGLQQQRRRYLRCFVRWPITCWWNRFSSLRSLICCYYYTVQWQ